MTKAQILRKNTGLLLAIAGIVLSLLPAVRMTDGTKATIFQFLQTENLFNFTTVTAEQLTVILLLIILIYGLLIHILNLILWLKDTEKTYLGVMAFSWASFLAMVMIACIMTMFDDGMISQIPFTIWQWIRIPVILFEAIMKLNREELFQYVLKEK